MNSSAQPRYPFGVRVIAGITLTIIALAQMNASIWNQSILGIEARVVSNISYLLGLLVFLYFVRMGVTKGSGTDE